MNQQNQSESGKLIKAALVSVGGSPAPVKYMLEKYKPEWVWYFCSEDSKKIADEIHSSLSWKPGRLFITVERFEEIAPCYKELREKIPELLKFTRVCPEEVIVDYTGGTKTMSAALVLAGVEFFKNFSYIGGRQRTGEGLGVVLDGKEVAFYQTNPWSELGVREIERAKDLWNNYLFEAAADVLEKSAELVPNRLKFKTIAKIAKGLAARHRLDFKGADTIFQMVFKTISDIYPGQEFSNLVEFVQNSKEICHKCSDKRYLDNRVILRELLDNCIRTAKQRRFEDAAARLYRAMELQIQIWLEEKTNGAVKKGRCNFSQLPVELKELDFVKPDGKGDVKFALENCIRALDILGDERVRRIVEDLNSKNPRWRQATENRNASILAHGIIPIGEDGFKKMKEIAADFLRFDVEQEANPIPQLDYKWLI